MMPVSLEMVIKSLSFQVGVPKTSAATSTFEITNSYVPAWAVRSADPGSDGITLDVSRVKYEVHCGDHKWTIHVQVLVGNARLRDWMMQQGDEAEESDNRHIEFVRSAFPEEIDVMESLSAARQVKKAHAESQKARKLQFNSVNTCLADVV